MKLTKGPGSYETGGCWMAVADYYSRGVRNWTDQPECVDPIIRPLCTRFNDWCEDGEREELIGPHLWAPIGTTDKELRPARLEKVVRFALDCAADALDAAGVEHGLRAEFGRDYPAAAYATNTAYYAAASPASPRASALSASRSSSASAYYAAAAAEVAANAANAAYYAGAGAYAANAANAAALAIDAYTDYYTYTDANAAEVADRKRHLLTLILDLCAMSTSRELPEGAVTQAEALRAVCGVTQ